MCVCASFIIWVEFRLYEGSIVYTSRQILWLAQCLGSNNKQWLALLALMQSGRPWTFFFCIHWNHFVWQCYFVIHNLLATWKPFTLYILSEYFVNGPPLFGAFISNEPHQKRLIEKMHTDLITSALFLHAYFV